MVMTSVCVCVHRTPWRLLGRSVNGYQVFTLAQGVHTLTFGIIGTQVVRYSANAERTIQKEFR